MAHEPAPYGLARLWRVLTATGTPHAIAPSELGEYLALWQEDPAHADAIFPEVARHLAGGCAACDRFSIDLLIALVQTQRIVDALRRQRAARPYLDALAADPDVLRDLRRYQQRRWDTTVLADVARLDRELRRRLRREA
jgi:hypothetical protein